MYRLNDGLHTPYSSDGSHVIPLKRIRYGLKRQNNGPTFIRVTTLEFGYRARRFSSGLCTVDDG